MKNFSWNEFGANGGVKRKNFITEAIICIVSTIIAALAIMTTPVKVVIPNEYWDVKPLFWVFVVALVIAIISSMKTILDVSDIYLFWRKNEK